MKWNQNISENFRTADLFIEMSMQFSEFFKKAAETSNSDVYFAIPFVKKFRSEPKYTYEENCELKTTFMHKSY